MARHGTVARYTKGCHCEDCNRVGRPGKAENARRRRRAARGLAFPCRFCTATFDTPRGRGVHETAIHDGGPL